jgi:hypothetical protein
MNTSLSKSFVSDIVAGEAIPPEKLGYFRGRFSNQIHELVLELFMELERAGKITRAELARRLGKAPEQLTRWLGAPGNWTLDTTSDLFLGMGYEPTISATNLTAQAEALSSAAIWEDMPSETSGDDSVSQILYSQGAVALFPQFWPNINPLNYTCTLGALTAQPKMFAANANRQGQQEHQQPSLLSIANTQHHSYFYEDNTNGETSTDQALLSLWGQGISRPRYFLTGPSQ